MRRFYVYFKNGKVYEVLAKAFASGGVAHCLDDQGIQKQKSIFTFNDEMGGIVANFFFDDVLCITNEKREGV